MVRIRHPNLFVDKCDGYIKILLVHSDKKRSACRNLFFLFFVHLGKKPEMIYENRNKFMEDLEITPIFHFRREFFAFERQIRSFQSHIFGILGEKLPK